MIDFGRVRAGELELGDLAVGLARADLAGATRAATADLLGRIDGAVDADVVFVPDDPAAEDTFADDAAEVGLAWTLGHVLVHLTASAEEAAFLGAELARGVEPHGRSRYEVPWRTLVTVEGAWARLRESERMILASLETWPDEPHLEVVFTTNRGATRNAPARFLGGLSHTDAHLGQVSEIVRQARAARTPGS
jgi:DinB superfamily